MGLGICWHAETESISCMLLSTTVLHISKPSSLLLYCAYMNKILAIGRPCASSYVILRKC